MQWPGLKTLPTTPCVLYVCTQKDIKGVRFLNHLCNKYPQFQNAIEKHVKGVGTTTVKSPSARYGETTKGLI